MDSPSAPAVGGFDVQLDGAAIGELWGPELASGNARLRHTVVPGVSLEADAGVLHVTNDGDGGDRNGYTGRLGVLLHSQDRHWALGAGLGGGVSHTAGSWGSADVHGAVSGAGRMVRPMLGVGLGYSAPFGHQMFTVPDPGGSPSGVTLQLPRNAFGQLEAGLEFGPSDRALILGASLLHFWARDDSRVGNSGPQSDDNFLALGIGLRLAL